MFSFAFAYCTNLTSVTLPHGLGNVDKDAFVDCNVNKDAFVGCNALVSVVLRPPVSRAFIAWCVGNSRNRVNWQATTVQRLRNVLRLITDLAMKSRDVTDLFTRSIE